MKLIKIFILVAAMLVGTELYAEIGLNGDSLIEVKPKTCDFQWWKGSKSYDATGTTDKTPADQTSTVKK